MAIKAPYLNRPENSSLLRTVTDQRSIWFDKRIYALECLQWKLGQVNNRFSLSLFISGCPNFKTQSVVCPKSRVWGGECAACLPISRPHLSQAESHLVRKRQRDPVLDRNFVWIIYREWFVRPRPTSSSVERFNVWVNSVVNPKARWPRTSDLGSAVRDLRGLACSL